MPRNSISLASLAPEYDVVDDDDRDAEGNVVASYQYHALPTSALTPAQVAHLDRLSDSVKYGMDELKKEADPNKVAALNARVEGYLRKMVGMVYEGIDADRLEVLDYVKLNLLMQAWQMFQVKKAKANEKALRTDEGELPAN